MIDGRVCLPQELAGGNLGQPCARLRNPSTLGRKNISVADQKLSPALQKALNAELAQTHPVIRRPALEDDEEEKPDELALMLAPPKAEGKKPWKLQLPTGERSISFSQGENMALIDACRRSAALDPIQALANSASAPSLDTRGRNDGNEMVAFSGTKPLYWMAARSRTVGAFGGDMGGYVAKDHKDRHLNTPLKPFKDHMWEDVMHKRSATDFHDLVDVLSLSMSKDKRQDMRSFRQPYNKHRHTMETVVTEDQNRRRVIRTLKKYPLVNIYDLARCDATEWTKISRDLGGVSHGAAMRCALEHVQSSMPPVERAAFWTAVGPRQPNISQGRTTNFAGDMLPMK